MTSSLQPSRLAQYSLAAPATATAATSGGAALADVTSGTLDISYGRSGGSAFFNGFDSASSVAASFYGAMGDLNMGLWAFQAGTYADASFQLSIYNSSYFNAYFKQSTAYINSYSSSVYGGGMVNAGAFWDASNSNTTSFLYGQIFWTYSTGGGTETWTNPDATGTKFVNFFIYGEGEADIYGWIQFDWSIGDADDWSLTVSNWAYSTDGPLAAGDSGSTPAVPGLGGLAALAVGAAGVRGRRQRAAG